MQFRSVQQTIINTDTDFVFQITNRIMCLNSRFGTCIDVHIYAKSVPKTVNGVNTRVFNYMCFGSACTRVLKVHLSAYLKLPVYSRARNQCKIVYNKINYYLILLIIYVIYNDNVIV